MKTDKNSKEPERNFKRNAPEDSDDEEELKIPTSLSRKRSKQ